MNKKTKYAMRGALWLGLANAAINAFKQSKEMDENPEKKFDWGDLLRAAGKGALVGGAGGAVIGAITDHENEKVKPVNTDAFLFTVVKDAKLSKNDVEYKELSEKADRLVTILKDKLGDKLASEPMRLGSTEKGTALASKFDIDICLPFKPNSFSTTEDMYFAVLEELEELVEKNSIIKIREQKKSLGVILRVRNSEYKIDVVPYKITKSKGNKSSGYLFVNSNEPTYTKTDARSIRSVRLTETQQKIIVILKAWKAKKNLPLSSHLLENLVLDAYHYNHVPKKFTDKVIMVLKHIRDNLNVAVIRSVENTNNIITDIGDSNKAEIIAACKEAIEDYEYQPNSIIETFKVDEYE